MGDYRFSNLVSGSAGWIQKVRKRDDQNVNRTEEDAYWGRVRFRPFDQLTFSARAETSSRDASTYQQLPATGAGAQQNPLLRKYYLTDRDRNAAQLQADIVPAARGSLSVRYERARDRYDESEVGLTLSDYDQVSADASVQLWARWSFRPTSAARTTTPTWWARAVSPYPTWRSRTGKAARVTGTMSKGWP
jgi:hypothetical protein